LTALAISCVGALVIAETAVRLFVIGDSYTEGYGVNDGEEFPRLVGQRLSQRYGPMTVINYGVGNTGNGRWIKILERDAVQ